jgi:hypothetical protein
MTDNVETTRAFFAQPELMRLIRRMFVRLGRPVRVMDPCYCQGNLINVINAINRDEGHKLILLIHRPTMSLGGSLEVNTNNLVKLKRFKVDLIMTNPPWSMHALCGVLNVLVELAQSKNIPLLFLMPWRCTRTRMFRELFKTKTLFTLMVEPQRFYGRPWTMDSSTLTWFACSMSKRPTAQWGTEPIRGVRTIE